jgi:nitrite reductase/ring-hydroxylating ferredoxin subunit
MLTASGVTLAALGQEGRKVVRRNGKQILLIAREGKVFAIANRCPHEGYPLSEGTQGPGCVLTCNWHNWKFDLETGAALIGRDPVRTYATEVRGSEIFLDLTDPPAEKLRSRALQGLGVAIADTDDARMAREVARLERAGFSAGVAIAHALHVSSEHLENGMTHAHAAAADWLALAARAPSEDARLAAQLEPIIHISWDTAGRGKFPYQPSIAAWDEERFLEAMEAEDERLAISLIRGAIKERVGYTHLRPVLARAALSHYADFGHSAIYVLRAGQLIARLDEDVSEPVMLALVRSLVQATREEKIPEFRSYAPALAAWSSGGKAPLKAGDLRGLNVDGALRRLLQSAGRNPRELFGALLGACAHNLLHFDLAFDRATDNIIADNVGWLDFTHALTFANAARQFAEEDPGLWPRVILQVALFCGRNAGYVTDDAGLEAWSVGDIDGFLDLEMSRLYDHGIVEPIVACHRLKVLFALKSEIAHDRDAAWVLPMCAGVNRYLNSPMKRRHGLRNATQAREFIASAE